MFTCWLPNGLYAVTTCPINIEVGTMTAPHACIGAVTSLVTSCCPAGKLEKEIDIFIHHSKYQLFKCTNCQIVIIMGIRLDCSALTGSVGPGWKWPQLCLAGCYSAAGWCWSAAHLAVLAGKSSLCCIKEQIQSPGSGVGVEVEAEAEKLAESDAGATEEQQQRPWHCLLN